MEGVVRWQRTMFTIALMLLLFLFALLTSGCVSTGSERKDSSGPFRLTVDAMDNDSSGIPTYVITDSETGCQYLVVRVYEGAGVTLLVDKYGNPLLADGYSRTEVDMSQDKGE